MTFALQKPEYKKVVTSDEEYQLSKDILASGEQEAVLGCLTVIGMEEKARKPWCADAADAAAVVSCWQGSS